jgi:hypothetical protein
MKNVLKTPFSFSLLRNSLIQFVWWVTFFPGFYSGDSFGAVAMAKSGELTNAGTASWAIYVRIFSLFGNAFPILTILSGLILVYGVTRLSYAIFEDKSAAITSFLLTLTPVVAGMGITLWHDIPFTSGLLLVVAFFITWIKNPEKLKSNLFLALIPGALLTSFKPNGLPTLIVFGILISIFKMTRASSKYVASAILLSGAFTFIGSNVIIGMSPINNYYAQEWMRGDISCFAATKQGQGFVEKEIPGIGNTAKWASKEGCNFLNKAKLSSDEKIDAEKYIPKAWFHLFQRDPLFVLKTHLTRHAYLVPLPLSGIPTEPFLHSTIEFKDLGVEWAFPSIAEKARVIMRTWNAARGLTGWAGLWVVVLFALAILRKQKFLIPAILMSISIIGVLFVVAPIPDGRYALFVLIAGQLAFIGNIIEWAQTGSNRRPTD